MKAASHRSTDRARSPARKSSKGGKVRAASPTAVPASELRVPADQPPWTFLTNHSHVLILLARRPSIVLREVALQVGITERAVQRIIAELEAGGFIEREKVGRQNHYRILSDRPLRHRVEAHRSIGELLELLASEK